MEFDTKITSAGVFYVPANIRRAFGNELKIIPNSTAAVFFAKDTRLEDVLISLRIIEADLEHRLRMKNGGPKNAQ